MQAKKKKGVGGGDWMNMEQEQIVFVVKACFNPLAWSSDAMGTAKTRFLKGLRNSNIFEASMLVNVSDLSSTFQEIVQQNFQEKTAILILVAPDVDALCACRILTVCASCTMCFCESALVLKLTIA